MATTIKTSSKNYFNKIQKYLNNKRVFFTPSLNHNEIKELQKIVVTP